MRKAFTLVELPAVSRSASLTTCKRGFTLVELLVVITIIVILVAMLVPALTRASQEAAKARCLSNLKTIGTAVVMYVNEFKRYPASPPYGHLFGSLGTTLGFENWDSDLRVFNPYLGYTGKGARVKVAECPADGGDPLFNTENCYVGYGNSYHEPYNAWAMGAVFNGQPSAAISPAHSKIILGDYGLYGDRPIRDQRTRWHQFEWHVNATAAEQVRQLNVLFADGRAEWYTFDNALVDDEADGNNRYRPINNSGPYW